MVKNPPAMQETLETWVQFLGEEDALENEMATYSSILACKIPWTEDPGGVPGPLVWRCTSVLGGTTPGL